ncbi:hypothetical protein BV98_003168 [Sphingobium herbicidovorans NBRC 16415]|jgi:hypothetical protein|uniref:Uncharacterized protein n=1 Tax=Sphingobium herbicidovorans (strain ATCC 700291 / DSM 11019 / CCUG 56400 / KCTC 2939 / LMG 18315 / NBRC 16415 / MH) TaxID=1219045 RepID=A0A086P6N2_SPHHM|nr:hypothetical protein BV98_003168 [Sphingobium herbicidovorans NBRC 16415]
MQQNARSLLKILMEFVPRRLGCANRVAKPIRIAPGGLRLAFLAGLAPLFRWSGEWKDAASTKEDEPG